MPSWKEILEQFALIRSAPVPFMTALIAIIGLVYFAENWAYSSVLAGRDSTIDSLKQRIALRDDQLSDKFKNTPPAEAQAIIQKLQQQVAALGPRELSADQATRFVNVVKT